MFASQTNDIALNRRGAVTRVRNDKLRGGVCGRLASLASGGVRARGAHTKPPARAERNAISDARSNSFGTESIRYRSPNRP